MSTTTTAPRTGRIVAISAATALAVAAVLGTVVVMVGRDASATPSSSSSSSTSGTNNKVEPSNAVKTIQAELAQLNFYDGPINGYDTPQTVAAVKDLQRQAGLPQTGHMDTQTRAALVKYLEQGDNVMNG